MRDILAVFICITSLLIKNTHAYVLLAANLDDFKSLAKKFVPDKLAQQLTNIAAHTALKYNREYSKLEEEQNAHKMASENPQDRAKEDGHTVMYNVRNSNYQLKGSEPEVLNISFDDLVRKVKKRIEDELMTSKMPTTKVEEQKMYDYVQDQSNTPDEYSEYLKTISNPVVNKENVKVENVIPEYGSKDDGNVDETTVVENVDINKSYEAERQKEKSPNTYGEQEQIRDEDENDKKTPDYPAAQEEEGDSQLPFAKVIMHQNDSYEDYIAPEREQNIYASDEQIAPPILVSITPPPEKKVVPFAKNVEEDNEKEDIKECQAEELKAETADLWYDYNDNGNLSVSTAGLSKNSVPTKKRKPTVIPKRDIYKISSPNYFAKIPVVAEKYDFNEPIPEKDREPEYFKPIKGLVGLSVNKKVKFS